VTCPALRLEDGAGLAATLKSLDCRTSEWASSAFDRLFGSHGALLPALTIVLTLYIAIFAIGLLTGRSRIGIASLTPRMLTLGLVLTFATSWMAYSQVVWMLATGGPDQIASVIAGTDGSATASFAKRLDELFSAIADAAQQSQPAPVAVAPEAGGAPVTAAAAPGATSLFTPGNLLWLSGLMLLVGTVGVLVTSRIALAALLAVGPVFIIFALFRGTRGLFEGWLKAVVSFALVPLFAVLIGGGTIALVAPLVRAALMEGGEAATRSGVALFLAACVYCMLMGLVLVTTRSIVAGWRLPFGREPAAQGGGVTVAPFVSPASAPISNASSAAAVRDVRLAALSLPSAANDAMGAGGSGGAAGGGSDRRTVTTQFLPASGGEGAGPAIRRDHRLQGLGSRFRSPQAPSPTRTRP
jgi:type IV secretion system protein VirB6